LVDESEPLVTGDASWPFAVERWVVLGNTLGARLFGCDDTLGVGFDYFDPLTYIHIIVLIGNCNCLQGVASFAAVIHLLLRKLDAGLQRQGQIRSKIPTAKERI
jgi:hypothetical protein